MATFYRAEYYELYNDVLFKKYKKDCDFEHQLQILLPDFSTIPEEARKIAEKTVTGIYAGKVAETATEDLLKKKGMIEDIKAGRASLGYISQTQEIREWHDLNEGFEFSCYMLKKFKEKYGIS